MEAYPNLIASFYRALKTDVVKLYPEYETFLETNFDWCSTMLDNDLSFVESLCLLGKAVERSLITPTLLECPRVFPLYEGTVLPFFLYPIFSELFYDSGLRRYNGDEIEITRDAAGAVFVLRQVLLAFSKAEDIESEKSKATEYAQFIARMSCRPEILAIKHHTYVTDPYMRDIFNLAKGLLRNVLMDEGNLAAPLQQWIDNPFGRHGPGAVADESDGFEKWDLTDSQLFSDVVSDNYYEPLYSKYEDQVQNDLAQYTESSIVTLVPKDFRGHRIICIESKERMFAQRALMDVIVDMTHSHPLASLAIRFDDQRPNQRLAARKGFATIDLKDASDMLSLALLKELLPKEAYGLLTKYRARSLIIHDFVDGDDFAPHIIDDYCAAFTMGNALCFPMETLVFWALSLATMIRCSTPFLRTRALQFIGNEGSWNITDFKRHFPLQVFGDDIVIPATYFSEICETLQEAGLVVNRQKSCYNTPVRESCGAWYYDNYDVRITRFSFARLSNVRVWDAWRRNAQELQSNGLLQSATLILNILVEKCPRAYGALGVQRPSTPGCIKGYRWNKDLQRVEVCLPTDRETGRYAVLVGCKGLYAWFTNQTTLRQTVRHGDREIEWRWVDLYSFQ